MANEQRLREMYNVSISNFKNLNQLIHVVLFCEDRVFDYIPDTYEIRPYNTVTWTKIRDDHYDDLFNLIGEIYKSLTDSFDTIDEINEIGIDFAIGIRSKQILAIDLNKMMSLYKDFPISQEISGVYNITELSVESKMIASQCKMLIRNLTELYSFWEFISATYDRLPKIDW